MKAAASVTSPATPAAASLPDQTKTEPTSGDMPLDAQDPTPSPGSPTQPEQPTEEPQTPAVLMDALAAAAPESQAARIPRLEISPGKEVTVGVKIWFSMGPQLEPVLVGQPRMPDHLVEDFFTKGVFGEMEEFEAMRPSQGKQLYCFRVDLGGGMRPITQRAAGSVRLSETGGFVFACAPFEGTLWASVGSGGTLAAFAGIQSMPMPSSMPVAVTTASPEPTAA